MKTTSGIDKSKDELQLIIKIRLKESNVPNRIKSQRNDMK